MGARSRPHPASAPMSPAYAGRTHMPRLETMRGNEPSFPAAPARKRSELHFRPPVTRTVDSQVTRRFRTNERTNERPGAGKNFRTAARKLQGPEGKPRTTADEPTEDFLDFPRVGRARTLSRSRDRYREASLSFVLLTLYKETLRQCFDIFLDTFRVVGHRRPKLNFPFSRFTFGLQYKT